MLDLLVIGAGISGLRTADLAIAAGLNTVVLEARDRVGGRLHSLPLDRGAVDLGATWFWAGERHVEQLIHELGVPVHAQHLAGDAVYHDPQQTRRLDGNPIDVPSGRFTAGAQDLAQRLADRLPPSTIRLGEAATAVHRTDDHLVVQTAEAEHAAQHVVLALPPALAAHAIEFTPPLPEPLGGLARSTPVWMGAIVKVVAVYPNAFWRDAGLAGAAMSHVGPMREIHDMSGPAGTPAALFGFVPLMEADQPAPTPEAVVDQLIQLFGPDAANPSALHLTDWRSESHTAPPGAELLRAYQTYGHPLWAEPAMDGRLHWSSTETAPVNPGHIDGALASAARVAATVIADRSPQRSQP